MPLPNLLHPVDVIIKQVDHSTTLYDDDAREAIQVVEQDDSVTLSGQIKWADASSLEFNKGGIRESAKGYVLFRKVDLDDESVTIQLNDQIIKMGHVVTDVYINRLEWTAHYADQNGPALLKAYFVDREPSK